MIHINILTCSDNHHVYDPHWDKSKYQESEFDIQINSTDDIEWDCVIVSQNLLKTTTFRCRLGNVFYISGEPPFMVPCPHSFTEQFDCVILPDPNVKHRNKICHHGFLPWTLGRSFKTKEQRYTFKYLQNLEPQKTKLISIVSSNQKMMPGHNKRVAIIEQLLRDYPEQIDVYGRGYHFIEYKADALFPYRFHICMENSFIPDYWTEKIEDPIVAQCVPIYSGCTNIDDYFGLEGYYKFDINNYESLKSIIERVLANPDGEYLSKKESLKKMRTILMEKENIIPFFANYLKDHPGGVIKVYNIKTLSDNKEYKTQLLLIRIKRFIFKQYFKAINWNKH